MSLGDPPVKPTFPFEFKTYPCEGCKSPTTCGRFGCQADARERASLDRLKIQTGELLDKLGPCQAHDRDSAQTEEVNHPSHYTQGAVECIDAIKAATVGKSGIEAACVANAIKYLWRYEAKGGRRDVEKAHWYIQRLLQEMK